MRRRRWPSSAGSAASPARSSARSGSSGCPRSGPTTTSCRCSRRASGCCSSCCTSPAASRRSATGCATRCCAGSRSGCLPPAPTKTVTAPPASLSHVARSTPATLNADGSVLATRGAHRAASAGSSRSTTVDFRGRARRGRRPHRQQRRRQVDAAQRDRRLRAEPRLGATARARRQPASVRTSGPRSASAARSRARRCSPS